MNEYPDQQKECLLITSCMEKHIVIEGCITLNLHFLGCFHHVSFDCSSLSSIQGRTAYRLRCQWLYQDEGIPSSFLWYPCQKLRKIPPFIDDQGLLISQSNKYFSLFIKPLHPNKLPTFFSRV